MTEQPAPKSPQKVLTQAQIATVRQWLKQKWTRPECPFHPGPTTWTVGDMVGRVRGLKDADFDSSASFYPVVMVHCDKCGYEVYLNAMMIGIVRP
jgi:hypothetical protein